MRRSVLSARGSKGYSWYNFFQKNGGNDGFKKAVPPTPFDWSSSPHIYVN